MELKMRYAAIEKDEIANGYNVGVSLYTQGCYIHCPGCFNSEIWNYEEGHPYGNQEILAVKKAISPNYITRFSILGGEPLSKVNYYFLNKTIEAVREYKPNISIWLYTGREYENIIQEDSPWLKQIMNQIDILVCGPFIQEEKDLTLAFRGSRNQRIINMKKTRENNNIPVLLEIN